MPLIREAPRHRDGFLQARPGDVVGRPELTLVDVRSEGELTRDGLGHIHGVYQQPLERLLNVGLPTVGKRTPVVVVCNNGRTSQDAAAALVRVHGFEEVYHLVGGMIRWSAEERPIARRPTWRSLPE